MGSGVHPGLRTRGNRLWLIMQPVGHSERVQQAALHWSQLAVAKKWGHLPFCKPVSALYVDFVGPSCTCTAPTRGAHAHSFCFDPSYCIVTPL